MCENSIGLDEDETWKLDFTTWFGHQILESQNWRLQNWGST